MRQIVTARLGRLDAVVALGVAALQTISVDCAHVQTGEDFWRVYLDTVKPQDGALFGRNLDAFWDALAGGPGWPGECVLRFVNTTPLKSIDGGRFYSALVEIAGDSRAVQVIIE